MYERDRKIVNKKIPGEVIPLVIKELVTLLGVFLEVLLSFAENVPVSCPASLNIPSVSNLKLALVPHQYN